jgi:hypothetical protein
MEVGFFYGLESSPFPVRKDKVGPSWFSLLKTELKLGVIGQALLYHFAQHVIPEVVNKLFLR